MAKDDNKDEGKTPPAPPAPPAKAPVKTLKVVRPGSRSNGGPTEATIPETSLPAWKLNGWVVKEN